MLALHDMNQLWEHSTMNRTPITIPITVWCRVWFSLRNIQQRLAGNHQLLLKLVAEVYLRPFEQDDEGIP
jgi:hypothetical protein